MIITMGYSNSTFPMIINFMFIVVQRRGGKDYYHGLLQFNVPHDYQLYVHRSSKESEKGIITARPVQIIRELMFERRPSLCATL